jgi:hypothetical protein
VNFFRSGGGCANTGELPGVSIHEWGHGLDENDGDPTLYEFGTGETYGDWTAALVMRTSCTGRGFLGGNCGGYGNPCTACTGVRDMNWSKHSANAPATVASHTYPRCPLVGSPSFYVGPCGLDRLLRGLPSGDEGHCESQVSTEALWDFVNRDFSGAGSAAAWATAERLWFLSRSTARGAFQCNSAVAPYTASGCNTGSLFRVLRAIDDDNGNLNDGTPHGGSIGAAFNRHGIACTSLAGWNTTRIAVARPAAPVLSATPGSNQVSLSWSGSSGRYDVFRNELGCSYGFQRIANDLSSASIIDNLVAGGTTYYYQVSAQPVGNESASSAPSNCVAVTPRSPIATGACVASGTTLCLNSNRFRANVSWRTATGTSGFGQAIPFTSDSGFYWFFASDNIELMIKVLDACQAPYNRYWVFHAATTNVEYTLTVTDTQNGQVKTYFNPLNHAATTILDTNAFATCP